MRVLITLDGTQECEVSLPFAGRLASQLGADIYLLRVLDGFAATTGHVHHEPEWEGGIGPEVMDMMKKARGYLDDVVARYELPAGRTRCLVGRNEDPAQEIVGIAKNNRIDLIVMSPHCRSKLQRLTRGSFCDDVMRARACPVLCVPEVRPADKKRHRVSTPAGVGR